MSWAMAVGATIAIVGGIIKSSKARKAKRKAESEQRRKEAQMNRFNANRQAVINPYAGVTSLAGMAKDLSGGLTNPYDSIGVATKAAEMEIEEADVSLANALDTLSATGTSAGGATALANAAAQSKKGVSANIEQQESANDKLRAQGRSELQQMQMSEKQRIQNIQISEGGRVQNAQAQGKAFKFNAQEARDQQTLDRMSGQESQARQNIAQANSDQQAAISGMISGVSSAVGGKLSSGGGGGGGGTTSSGGYNFMGNMQTNTSGVGFTSDRRLKENINSMGKSPSGLNIYSFEYVDKSFGEGTYSGVMSDEIPNEAVMVHDDGFDRVDYSKLDVEFKKIKS